MMRLLLAQEEVQGGKSQEIHLKVGDEVAAGSNHSELIVRLSVLRQVKELAGEDEAKAGGCGNSQVCRYGSHHPSRLLSTLRQRPHP